MSNYDDGVREAIVAAINSLGGPDGTSPFTKLQVLTLARETVRGLDWARFTPIWDALAREGTVQTPKSSTLDSSRVRSARTAVMKKVLLPRGFVKSTAGPYVRVQGGQIHLIDFQASNYGGRYTVNLGFHFACAPGFLSHTFKPPTQYHLLDCALQARIGRFLKPDGPDLWFEYGSDPSDLRALLARNALDCVRVFDEQGSRWSDPWRWVEQQQALQHEAQTGPGFRTDSVSRACLCTWIALHLGRRCDASEWLGVLRSHAEPGFNDAAVAALSRALGEAVD